MKHLITGLLGFIAVAACAEGPAPAPPTGEITARVAPLAQPSAEHGLRRIASAALYVPDGISADRPAPFILLLHGAGDRGENMIRRFRDEADKRGIILLAPDSEGRTWDVMVSLGDRPGQPPRYGDDPARIDAALKEVFARYNIDPRKVAIAGFSDGAGYALSLGAENGPLFRSIMAFSAGVLMPFSPEARPRVFISHGTKDRIIPISSPKNDIIPALRGAGFDVEFHEFDGGHEIPPAIMKQALDWFLHE